jgi:hypothetical protein
MCIVLKAVRREQMSLQATNHSSAFSIKIRSPKWTSKYISKYTENTDTQFTTQRHKHSSPVQNRVEERDKVLVIDV